MKKYQLKLENDVVNTIFSENISDAIIYFSIVKNLSSEDLLLIFKVIESEC